MRKLILTASTLAALVVPTAAIAHPSAQALIKRAVGPGTVVSACHRHDHGVLCHYTTPASNVGVTTEYESGEPGTGVWESYAAVEHGRVRFS